MEGRYLANYLKREDDRGQTINVKLFAEAVTVKKDPNTGGLQIKDIRKAVVTDGVIRLRDGDYVRLSVQNASSGNVPVFVTVLRIGRDGVFPIYPPRARRTTASRRTASSQARPLTRCRELCE